MKRNWALTYLAFSFSAVNMGVAKRVTSANGELSDMTIAVGETDATQPQADKLSPASIALSVLKEIVAAVQLTMGRDHFTIINLDPHYKKWHFLLNIEEGGLDGFKNSQLEMEIITNGLSLEERHYNAVPWGGATVMKVDKGRSGLGIRAVGDAKKKFPDGVPWTEGPGWNVNCGAALVGIANPLLMGMCAKDAVYARQMAKYAVEENDKLDCNDNPISFTAGDIWVFVGECMMRRIDTSKMNDRTKWEKHIASILDYIPDSDQAKMTDTIQHLMCALEETVYNPVGPAPKFALQILKHFNVGDIGRQQIIWPRRTCDGVYKGPDGLWHWNPREAPQNLGHECRDAGHCTTSECRMCGNQGLCCRHPGHDKSRGNWDQSYYDGGCGFKGCEGEHCCVKKQPQIKHNDHGCEKDSDCDPHSPGANPKGQRCFFKGALEYGGFSWCGGCIGLNEHDCETNNDCCEDNRCWKSTTGKNWCGGCGGVNEKGCSSDDQCCGNLKCYKSWMNSWCGG